MLFCGGGGGGGGGGGDNKKRMYNLIYLIEKHSSQRNCTDWLCTAAFVCAAFWNVCVCVCVFAGATPAKKQWGREIDGSKRKDVLL